MLAQSPPLGAPAPAPRLMEWSDEDHPNLQRGVVDGFHLGGRGPLDSISCPVRRGTPSRVEQEGHSERPAGHRARDPASPACPSEALLEVELFGDAGAALGEILVVDVDARAFSGALDRRGVRLECPPPLDLTSLGFDLPQVSERLAAKDENLAPVALHSISRSTPDSPRTKADVSMRSSSFFAWSEQIRPARSSKAASPNVSSAGPELTPQAGTEITARRAAAAATAAPDPNRGAATAEVSQMDTSQSPRTGPDPTAAHVGTVSA